MAFFIAVFSASFFTWALPLVEAFRVAHPDVMLAMPLLVFLIWWDRTKPDDVLSTRAKVAFLQKDAHHLPRKVSIAAGLKQIGFTLITHAVGGSVGREAVGLQLGAWAARLRGARGWYFGACMAIGFAIVLGTPVAAAIFIFESKRWRLTWIEWAGVPLLAWLGYRLSLLLGVIHPELYAFNTTITELQSLGHFNFVIFTIALITLSTFVSFLFLRSLHFVATKAAGGRRHLHFAVGALCVVTVAFYFIGFSKVDALGLAGLGTRGLYALWTMDPLTVTLGTHPLVIALFKVLLTAVFVGLGLRGGELTPLLVAGGLIAAGIAVALGYPVAGVVALGFSLVWGITARRPITAAILAIEIFGFAPWGAIGVFVLIATWLGIKAGDYIGLYARRGGVDTGPGFWRRGLYD